MVNSMINVEVAFATNEKQVIIRIAVPINSTIVNAITLSGIAVEFPNFDMLNMPFGIFGKKVENSYILREADRIEIYRPLSKTPNQRRLERANK